MDNPMQTFPAATWRLNDVFLPFWRRKNAQTTSF